MLEKIIPKCYDSPEEQKKLWWHPHSSPSRTSNGTNLIFTSSDKLSFDANKPGAGLLYASSKGIVAPQRLEEREIDTREIELVTKTSKMHFAINSLAVFEEILGQYEFERVMINK